MHFHTRAAISLSLILTCILAAVHCILPAQREREREIYIYTIHTVYLLYIYIYIHICKYLLMMDRKRTRTWMHTQVYTG